MCIFLLQLNYTILFCMYFEVSKITYMNVNNQKSMVYTIQFKREKESLKMVGTYIVIDQFKGTHFFKIWKLIVVPNK